MDKKDLGVIVDVHNAYWDRYRVRMRDLTRAYNGCILGKEDMTSYRDLYGRVVELSDGYALVESYMSSLFLKGPAVAVSQGPDEEGDAHTVESVANRFLWDQQPAVEQLLRQAIIYPFSVLKLGLNVNTKGKNPRVRNVLDQVDMRVVYPWDVIVDMSATRWDLQRYTGIRLYVPMLEAIERWGNKRWKPAAKNDYLEETNSTQGSIPVLSAGGGVGRARKEEADRYISSDSKESKALSWVEVWEVYDMQAGEVVWWSPCLPSNDGIVDREDIPFSFADGSPCAPLVPLYIGMNPQFALQGQSTLGRSYDLIWEKTTLRTVESHAFRRDSRLWGSKKGTLSEEAKARIAENKDMSVIEVDILPDQSIQDALFLFPTATLSPDFERYESKIQQDLDRGNILAPFTRGVATNSTATEIAALTQYTDSEIGRMARCRDRAMELTAETYIRMLHSILVANPDAKTVTTVDAKTTVLTADAIDGDFRYAASDQSSTPLSASIRRQRFIEVLPMVRTLATSTAPIDKILLEHLVQEFDLPRDILSPDPGPSQAMPVPGATVPPPGGQSEGAPAGPGPLPIGGGSVAADIRAGGPQPSDIETGDGN